MRVVMSGRNMLKNLVLANRNLAQKLQCNFASFPSREQKRSEKQMGYTGFQPNLIFKDDLYYPMENEVQRKSLDDLINHIKTHPNLTIEGRGLCTILYMIAKYDRHEPFIFAELERHLYKFKESLSGRLSFGGLYASYKCIVLRRRTRPKLNPDMQKDIQFSAGYDAIELVRAMSINTTKSQQYKIDFFNQTLRTIILKKFDNDIRPYTHNLYNLFTGLRDMKIYDEELFQLVLKYLPARKGLTNVKNVADVYETLCVFKEEGLLKQNLDGHIESLEKKLIGRLDFKWRYNISEKRMFSYDELVANRENYEGKDQSLHKYKFSHPENITKFNLVQSDKDALKAEHEARERTRELESLVYEMFELKNKGEITQTEDKNTLLGTYDKIVYTKEEDLENEEEEEGEDEPSEEVDEGIDFTLKSDKPKVKGAEKNKQKHPKKQ